MYTAWAVPSGFLKLDSISKKWSLAILPVLRRFEGHLSVWDPEKGLTCRFYNSCNDYSYLHSSWFALEVHGELHHRLRQAGSGPGRQKTRSDRLRQPAPTRISRPSRLPWRLRLLNSLSLCPGAPSRYVQRVRRPRQAASTALDQPLAVRARPLYILLWILCLPQPWRSSLSSVQKRITKTVRRKHKEQRKLKKALDKAVNKKWKCDIWLVT